MTLPVKLRDVVDAMDAPADGWMAYINRRTGEIVSFSEDEVAFHDDDDDEIIPDWQADLVAKAKEAKTSDDFAQLPDKFDIHEYTIMERFCHSVDDDKFRADLLDAIQGSGAFRRFKSVIRRRGLEQSWWSYRDTAFEKVATDFLEMEDILFEGR